MTSRIYNILIYDEHAAENNHVITNNYFTNMQIFMLGNDAEVHPFVRVCESDYSTYFGWVLYVIQGGLLSFGAFLAWETKHVSKSRQ